MKQAQSLVKPAAQDRVRASRPHKLADEIRAALHAHSGRGLRKGLETWAHWGSWKQSGVSEIEDVAETRTLVRNSGEERDRLLQGAAPLQTRLSEGAGAWH